MVEDVSTGVGCKKYISMVESAVKKISEQRKVSRHQEGLYGLDIRQECLCKEYD